MNHKTGPEQPDCASLRDLIPAYALGAVDAEERAQIEAGLTYCPELAEEIAAYKELTDAIHFAAPQVAPPPELGARILNAVAPAPAPEPVRIVERQRPALRFGWVAAAVALVLLAVSNGYWLVQLNELRSEHFQISERAENQRRLLDALGSGSANEALLTAAPSNQVPQAVLNWTFDPDGLEWVVLLSVEGLEPLAAGDYQLWLMPDESDSVISAGLFSVNELGRGSLVFALDEPVTAYQWAGITAEPPGGSPAPTSDPLVTGIIQG